MPAPPTLSDGGDIYPILRPGSSCRDLRPALNSFDSDFDFDSIAVWVSYSLLATPPRLRLLVANDFLRLAIKRLRAKSVPRAVLRNPTSGGDSERNSFQATQPALSLISSADLSMYLHINININIDVNSILVRRVQLALAASDPIGPLIFLVDCETWSSISSDAPGSLKLPFQQSFGPVSALPAQMEVAGAEQLYCSPLHMLGTAVDMPVGCGTESVEALKVYWRKKNGL
ncbi:hypothetical protein DFH09DRAFT_1092916 [Mycena vulgaris]|nr:hypothetical protein DFH09DRAFT_1092916 [Mycena vulgaris]